MTRPTIYDRHDKAFPHVSAYVVLAKPSLDRVATIAFKYPKDGAGRLYAYIHWLGVEMVRGFAAGGGYDKRSAACADAARKIRGAQIWDKAINNGFGGYLSQTEEIKDPIQLTFIEQLKKDDGYSWDRRLTDHGFVVWQAV